MVRTPRRPNLPAAGISQQSLTVAVSGKLTIESSEIRIMAFTIPWNLIGIEVSGDIGNLTIYTDRFGKKVAFPKAPPKEPPSQRQVLQRAAFKSAQAAWMSLTSDQKNALEESTKKVSAPLTGQNLFISAGIRNDNADLVTFERQSGITLPRV